jgi:hypothetical protein
MKSKNKTDAFESRIAYKERYRDIKSMSTTGFSNNTNSQGPKYKKVSNYTLFKNKQIDNFVIENYLEKPNLGETFMKNHQKNKRESLTKQQIRSKSTAIEEALSNNTTAHDERLNKLFNRIYSPQLGAIINRKKDLEKFGQKIDKQIALKKQKDDNCFDTTQIRKKIADHSRVPNKNKYYRLQTQDFESSEDESFGAVTNRISQRASQDKTSSKDSQLNAGSMKKKPIHQSNTCKDKNVRKESIPNSSRVFLLRRQHTIEITKPVFNPNKTERVSLGYHTSKNLNHVGTTIYSHKTSDRDLNLNINNPSFNRTETARFDYKPKIKLNKVFNKVVFLEKYDKMIERIDNEKERKIGNNFRAYL